MQGCGFCFASASHGVSSVAQLPARWHPVFPLSPQLKLFEVLFILLLKIPADSQTLRLEDWEVKLSRGQKAWVCRKPLTKEIFCLDETSQSTVEVTAKWELRAHLLRGLSWGSAHPVPAHLGAVLKNWHGSSACPVAWAPKAPSPSSHSESCCKARPQAAGSARTQDLGRLYENPRDFLGPVFYQQVTLCLSLMEMYLWRPEQRSPL